jgi:lysophospholipase L1-like esterase
MKRSVLAGVMAVSIVVPLCAAEKSPSGKWEKSIQAFEEADKTNPPPQGAALFIGSSTIKLWKTLQQDFPEYKVINRGFGGSQIADSVYYADRIVVPYKPKMIVFYAGSNDLNARKTPEKVCGDFRMFVEKVRAKLPDVRIAFMSIGPSLARWAQFEKQKKTNELIKQYIMQGNNMDYIDAFDVFLGPDGKPRENLFVKDKLHNSAEGYKVRVELVRPYLKKCFEPK